MSSWSEARHRRSKLLTPIVYALIFPVTVYFTFAVFYHAPPIILASEISFFGVPVLIFSSVYAVYGTLLLLLERPATLGILTHLRRSSLMYAGFVIFFSITLIQPFPGLEGENYWRYMVFAVFCLCAIIVDLAILSLAKRLGSRVSSQRTMTRSSV